MRVEIEPTERPAAFVLSIDGRPQSYVDLDDPGRLEFDYVRRIGDVIDGWGSPGRAMRVLHVGGGALTLPRYVAWSRPGSAQVVLEPVESVTRLVRSELPLPQRSGIKVRPVDGRSGLVALRDGSYDLVVVDAFVDGSVPDELVTAECAQQYARVLRGDGWLLLNLVDSAPFAWTRRVVAAVRSVLPALLLSAEPATLRGRRSGNLLLVAGAAGVPADTLAARAASSPAPYRVLTGAQVLDRVGGGRPLTDAELDGSP
ncbi:MAG: fused MFS/spermidine synthase [Nocardioides sp.]